jgi:hypothetical protein
MSKKKIFGIIAAVVSLVIAVAVWRELRDL